MKTVLIYKNELLPLTETFIYAQAQALMNFRVRFVGLKPSPGGLPVHSNSILLTEDDSPQSKIRRQLFKRFMVGRRFFNRLAQEKPDVIHAHFAVDATDAMCIAKKLGIPMVTTLHGYDVTTRDDVFAKNPEGRRFLRRRDELAKITTKFLCSCEHVRNRAAALGFPRDKMEVLYSGLDLDKLTPGTEPRNPNLILYVGRLIEKKGISYLLKAAAKVAQVNPAVEVAVIGVGPLLEPMQALARELKINCKFLGRLDNPEPGNSVHDWMRRARVFCGPSVTASDGNTEGVPFVFVESHALGLPAVSFQTAGIGEAVLHGETGLLAPEKDVDILSEYLLRLLQDESFWQACSTRAKQWVWERFDLRVLTQQLQRVYTDAIATHPRNLSESRVSEVREEVY
jgi:colanic acid/amylovoran biosynthesis glycosyltransferase